MDQSFEPFVASIKIACCLFLWKNKYLPDFGNSEYSRRE